MIEFFADFFLNIDKNLLIIIEKYGFWIYLLVFIIIFCETGLVVTPFLPGDSLLFALGTISATGVLSLPLIFTIVSVAAILGNIVNYQIGYLVGPKIFYKENVRFLNKEHLIRTRLFYERHGGKVIVISRFLPIFRTFAPFVAGIGRMEYWRFTLYNIVGCFAWVTTFVIGGYYFGNIELIKNNFSLVIIAIILISILPALIELIRNKKSGFKSKSSPS
ncbi:MAG: DedA family protein [Thermodesulfovibrionales bacterium]|nr:DedA family protein [Thermodesulfovibrionales bacterium]